MFGRIYAWCLFKVAKWLGVEVGMDYHDWVRSSSNRELASEMLREHEARKEAAKHWSDEQLFSEVSNHILGRSSDPNLGRILKSLGERVNPFILQVMEAEKDDPGFLKDPDKKYESSFSRACDLMTTEPPVELLPLVKPHVFHTDFFNASGAIHVVGLLASHTDYELLDKILLESDSKSHLVYALSDLLKKGKLNDELKTRLFETLTTVIEQGESSSALPKLLYELDREKAVEFFPGDAALDPDSNGFFDVFNLMNEEKLPVKREKLHDLIERIGDGYYLSYVLVNLGLHENTEDRALFQGIIDQLDMDRDAREGAMQGLAGTYGLNGLYKEMYDLTDGAEYELWPEELKWFTALYALNGEVNNGGFSQYYTNSTAETWPEALEALKVMGSVDLLAVFQESLSRFGGKELSRDWIKRGKQMDAYFGRNPELLDDLDDRWYDSSESAGILFHAYAIQHHERFKEILKKGQ